MGVVSKSDERRNSCKYLGTVGPYYSGHIWHLGEGLGPGRV